MTNLSLVQQLDSQDLLNNTQGVVAGNRHIIKPEGMLAGPAEDQEEI